MGPVSVSPPAIAEALIHWQRVHGRHDLPWQRERTPYRVWISEIMLQQTQVATVIGYYERFVQRFPDVLALASASLDEVLHLWSGLGYYSRARNLQRAAQRIVAEHGGQLPEDPAVLESLPGIGRSTAAAIVALSLDRRATILDGNVRRVLARYFGIEGTADDRATQAALWQHAQRCTPERDVGVYTQAIMDFGATLCTRSRPLCMHCPLNADCVAHGSGRVAELPTPRRRPQRPTRHTVMLLAVRADGSVLLRRRPARGVWAQLWTPPEFADLDAARSFCAASAAPGLDALPRLRHAFTHFDLEITPLRVAWSGGADGAVREPRGGVEGPETLWYNARQPPRIGIPAPIAVLLASLSTLPQAQPPADG
ncbi:MAG TPA: A/G-specific adenine glycosylase [Steroidobacteraceae bacterium]|nr:A/G-specific adenine glycosylase [Steroidobacteraceae bacterium]